MTPPEGVEGREDDACDDVLVTNVVAVPLTRRSAFVLEADDRDSVAPTSPRDERTAPLRRVCRCARDALAGCLLSIVAALLPHAAERGRPGKKVNACVCRITVGSYRLHPLVSFQG